MRPLFLFPSSLLHFLLALGLRSNNIFPPPLLLTFLLPSNRAAPPPPDPPPDPPPPPPDPPPSIVVRRCEHTFLFSFLFGEASFSFPPFSTYFSPPSPFPERLKTY